MTADCKIVHEDFTKVLSCVLDYCTEQGFSYYRKMSHEGYLRHLLVRRAQTTGDILVHLVTSSQTEHDFKELTEQLLRLPLDGKIVGIMHIINDSLGCGSE